MGGWEDGISLVIIISLSMIVIHKDFMIHLPIITKAEGPIIVPIASKPPLAAWLAHS